MKKLFILFAANCIIACSLLVQAHENKSPQDETLRKSSLYEPPEFRPDMSSFPMNFSEINNPVNQAAVSTGYYFVDSDDPAPDYWRPSPFIIDTTTESNLWRRILPGPRLRSPDYWQGNPDGLCFFRNPALPLPEGDFFNGATDSTDDAIAGPIPIGFDFYFNGLKYDSFYVSTNGIIALTNSRYFYNSNGYRIVPQGKTDAYNPMSMDWFYEGRNRYGNGITDSLPDDFGYIYSVCGGNPLDLKGGIRSRGGELNQEVFTVNKSALIAPFFGDMHLSQWNEKLEKPEDWGKVYFKRSQNSDKLIIYIINIAPVRTLNTPYGDYNGEFNLRPGDANYLSSSAQVTLDKKDSSVNIVYERFEGVAVVANRGVAATTIFRYNTTVGVHGFARHVNYGQSEPAQHPWAGEYQQYTHYYSRYANPNRQGATFPRNYLAIRFKQCKNTLRIVDISFRVRKTDLDANTEFTETVPASRTNNYELLAGEERIGVLQPVAIIQNLSNDIQGPNGVNYQKQQLNFRARCRIINEASLRIIYNRLIQIDSTCLALGENDTADCTGNPYERVRFVEVAEYLGDYASNELPFPGTRNNNGIPPYGFVQVYFAPFEPNEFVNNQIGRLKIDIIAEPTDPKTNESLGDSWPFDDTATVRIFSMRRLEDFEDDVTSYHDVNRRAMPSTLKWVNIDAEVVDSEWLSYYPLPPRGKFPPTNNKDCNFSEPDFTIDIRESPAIKMNRLTLDGREPATSPGGDELRSFPIDLRGRFGAVLKLSIQRNARRDDWSRGWSDQELIGPEPRAVINANPFAVWDLDRAVSSQPDELALEFAQPSPDGVNYLTNIDEPRWRVHPRRYGAEPITNMPVLSVFGAGGYMVGWLESDRDSALSYPSSPNIGGLRPDIYDDGVDFEYRRFFLSIPDTFIKAKNEGAKNFRFRLKMYARDNRKCLSCIPDDDDPYFIDNVNILIPCECFDLEMTSVKIIWPYSITPASQAMKIPVRATVSTHITPSLPFRVKVRIFAKGDTRPIYCRTENLPFISGKSSLEIAMPDWNARKSGPGIYRLIANLSFGDVDNPDYDMVPSNDTTYTDVKIRIGDVFAYDPADNPRNDVPDKAFTGIPGGGLRLQGYSYGGEGTIYGNTGGYDNIRYGSGYIGGSANGQIAMKFTLNQQDTIYGYQAYFAAIGFAFDDITLSVYRGSTLPTTRVNGSFVKKFRGFDDIRRDGFFDEYVTYLLPEPLILEAGDYWYAIGQLAQDGLELGASKTRMGMRVTSVYIPPPVTDVKSVGEFGYHLMIHKEFRKRGFRGHLINDNRFAYENTIQSGNWVPFMPTIGNPAYAHLHHFGLSTYDNTTLTLSRGTWIPMLRPFFGTRTFGTEKIFEECPDDIPVELIYFDGLSRHNGIELYWETVTEINNEGFYVEKRIQNQEVWNSIGFVKGVGNSKSVNQYSMLDRQVQLNTTYQYRLRQVDFDGAMTCETNSPVITLTYEGQPELTLQQNIPNPVKNFTSITFTTPDAGNIRLDILDIFGNVVKTLVNENVGAGTRTIEWNAIDNNNSIVPSGTYLARLIAGSESRTIKMTVVK